MPTLLLGPLVPVSPSGEPGHGELRPSGSHASTQCTCRFPQCSDGQLGAADKGPSGRNGGSRRCSRLSGSLFLFGGKCRVTY